MDFRKGLHDSIPIMLGYFSVSTAFGLMAVEAGCSALEAVLISATNLTSAGQFAGLTVMAQAGTYIEMALTQFIINARYSLMAISLSQKVDSRFRGLARIILGFAITDELFAVAIGKEGEVSRQYFAGLIILPILGWSSGTLTGALLGNILPAIVSSAMGVALYGMFIAIVVPKARDDRRVLITVAVAIAVSCILFYVPAFDFISAGFAIIISTLVASAVGAIFFPVKEGEV